MASLFFPQIVCPCLQAIVHPHFQTSFSQKLLIPLKSKFMWNIFGSWGMKAYVIDPGHMTKMHTTGNYNRFSFSPSILVYWIQLPANIVLLPVLICSVWLSGRMTSAYCKTTQQFNLNLFLSLLYMLFNPIICPVLVLACQVSDTGPPWPSCF